MYACVFVFLLPSDLYLGISYIFFSLLFAAQHRHHLPGIQRHAFRTVCFRWGHKRANCSFVLFLFGRSHPLPKEWGRAVSSVPVLVHLLHHRLRLLLGPLAWRMGKKRGLVYTNFLLNSLLTGYSHRIM